MSGPSDAALSESERPDAVLADRTLSEGSNNAPELARLQRWLQAVITHPGGVQAGLSSGAAQVEISLPPSEVERTILRSRALDSVSRLEVYANAYYARLLECLREIFPVSAALVGEEMFNEFAWGCLQRYPPRSYTLARLADRFPQYLAETRPPAELDLTAVASADIEAGDIAELFSELTRLEWEISQVFDGPGTEREPSLTAEFFSGLSAAEWGDCRFELAPCLRLLRFRYPVNSWFTALRQEAPPPALVPRPSCLALTRRNYVVRRIELSEPACRALESLGGGATIQESLAAAAACWKGDWEGLSASLRDWFCDWTAAGLLWRLRQETS